MGAGLSAATWTPACAPTWPGGRPALLTRLLKREGGRSLHRRACTSRWRAPPRWSSTCSSRPMSASGVQPQQGICRLHAQRHRAGVPLAVSQRRRAPPGRAHPRPSRRPALQALRRSTRVRAASPPIAPGRGCGSLHDRPDRRLHPGLARMRRRMRLTAPYGPKAAALNPAFRPPAVIPGVRGRSPRHHQTPHQPPSRGAPWSSNSLSTRPTDHPPRPGGEPVGAVGLRFETRRELPTHGYRSRARASAKPRLDDEGVGQGRAQCTATNNSHASRWPERQHWVFTTRGDQCPILLTSSWCAT
jgi:hypothetical protein